MATSGQLKNDLYLSVLIKIILFPFWLIWAWILGMIRLVKNETHPHPEVRAKFMIFFAGMLAQAGLIYPLIYHAGKTVVWSYLGATVLVIGWGSYLVNHRWRHAFF